MGDFDGAVNDLLRGGEVDLAYAVATVTGAGNRELAVARLAQRCEAVGLTAEAVRLLLGTRDGTKEVCSAAVPCVCVFVVRGGRLRV